MADTRLALVTLGAYSTTWLTKLLARRTLFNQQVEDRSMA
jgi:hypothetical protein